MVVAIEIQHCCLGMADTISADIALLLVVLRDGASSGESKLLKYKFVGHSDPRAINLYRCGQHDNYFLSLLCGSWRASNESC